MITSIFKICSLKGWYHIEVTTGGNDDSKCEDKMPSLYLENYTRFNAFLCINDNRIVIVLKLNTVDMSTILDCVLGTPTWGSLLCRYHLSYDNFNNKLQMYYISTKSKDN